MSFKLLKGERELLDAGYTYVAQQGWPKQGIPFGRWFTATDPTGHRCVIFRQAANAWHWFDADLEATASGTTAATAHKGGLGDAIDTDSMMRGYEKALKALPGPFATRYAGLYRACCQVFSQA